MNRFFLIVFLLIFFLFSCDEEMLSPIGRWNPNDPSYEANTDPNNIEGTVPIAPSQLIANIVSDTAINLQWRNNYNFASWFAVYRRDSADSDFIKIADNLDTTSFGDTGLNDEHTYFYCVNAINEYGESEMSSTIEATTAALDAPVADFSASATTGILPFQVIFTDKSNGAITSWAWDFDNDGVTDSTKQNPSFTYNSSGNYTVKLTLSGPKGTDTEIKTDYITVYESTYADFSVNVSSGVFPLSVSFSDASVGEVNSWAWDFNNDSVTDSTIQNPQYTYNSEGVYTVSLSVSGPGGTDSETKTNLISVSNPVVANFSANVTRGDAPLSVTFTDESSGGINVWQWDFDNDGEVDYSGENPPPISLVDPGYYSVRLFVSGASGNDEEIKQMYIIVDISSCDYWVDAVNGSDSFGDGSKGAPFKTISHTLTVSGADNVIQLLPGTYNATLEGGSAFPIMLQSGQKLIGDVHNKGNGDNKVIISGKGAYSGNEASLVPANNCQISGILFDLAYTAGDYGVYVSNIDANISDNTFQSIYAGIRLIYATNSTIENNIFNSHSYGVMVSNISGNTTISDNVFNTPSIPLTLSASSGSVSVLNNTIIGSGQSGFQVSNTAANIILIQGNYFNNPTGYQYGAISCSSDASPKIRNNVFECDFAINIRDYENNASNPDLGTNSITDAGNNDFSSVTGNIIYHSGSANILAYGNDWRNQSGYPTRGSAKDGTEEIIVYSSSGNDGSVRGEWGTYNP